MERSYVSSVSLYHRINCVFIKFPHSCGGFLAKARKASKVRALSPLIWSSTTPPVGCPFVLQSKTPRGYRLGSKLCLPPWPPNDPKDIKGLYIGKRKHAGHTCKACHNYLHMHPRKTRLGDCQDATDGKVLAPWDPVSRRFHHRCYPCRSAEEGSRPGSIELPRSTGTLKSPPGEEQITETSRTWSCYSKFGHCTKTFDMRLSL